MGNQLGRSRIITLGYALLFWWHSIFTPMFLIIALRNIPTRRVLVHRPRIDPRVRTNHKHRSEKMNWDRVEGNWKQFKGSVQEKWGKLTDDDLDVIEGKRTQLAGRLQQRYGVAKDQAEKEIDAWLKTVN